VVRNVTRGPRIKPNPSVGARGLLATLLPQSIDLTEGVQGDQESIGELRERFCAHADAARGYFLP
jgi:hypothetical protein